MIKKTTKVIFKESGGQREEELVGGIPLSKGDIVKIHEKGSVNEWVVSDKIVNCFLNGDEQTAEITYVLEKM